MAAIYYVAEENNNRIQKFNSAGGFLLQFNGGKRQFYRPIGVEVDGNGSVYVADAANHRIQKFNSSGVFLSLLGSFGNGDGQFNYPCPERSGVLHRISSTAHRFAVSGTRKTGENLVKSDRAGNIAI